MIVTEKEYSRLLNQYHVAIAKGQDLNEQLKQKQEQWASREEAFNTTEKLVRELCESVLAKDSKEMVLGADYSWSAIPINELINKAKRALREYIEVKNGILQNLMDNLEDRRRTIEGLEEQISVMKMHPEKVSLSQEELNKEIEKEKKEKEALGNMSADLIKQANKGNVEVLTEVHTEDNDPSPYEELAMFEDSAKKGAAMQITPKSVPVTESRKNYERKKEMKENAMKKELIDLNEYAEKLNETDWLVMDAIGTQGISLNQDIINYVRDHSDATSSRVNISISRLKDLRLIRRESVKNPLKSIVNVHQLAPMGARVYKGHFKKEPVLSEMDILIAEHDNVTHGYGIKFLSEAIKETGIFKEVIDKNRKNPIPISEGVSYIPDVVCVDENGAKIYIEYEHATHTQTNFNAKCNKMCRVTSVLNFVGPNREVVEKLMVQTEKWMKDRGHKYLKNVTIRITSVAQIKEKDIRENKSWRIVYEPGKSDKPHVNFKQ